MHSQELIAAVLMYGIVPIWLGSGLADYACHRVARIERTSGLEESLMHSAQLAVVGIPALAALFLEINGAVLTFMLVALLLHEALAVWDVRFADARRTIAPVEQHVHGVLECVPWVALILLAILHWDAIGSFQLAVKRHPLPPAYLAAVLIGMGLFGAMPFGEELLRCWRARR
jgi:hypothetical protein